MKNWARANFILSSRKKKILLDRQNFGYQFKCESETGARYWVCRLRDLLGCTATASTIERNDATFTKNVNNTHNHSSKLVEKRVKMAEQEAVENAVRNPTLTCKAVMAELAYTLQTDSMAAASSMSRMSTIKQRIYKGRYIMHCTVEAKLPTSANYILNMNDQYRHLDSWELFLV